MAFSPVALPIQEILLTNFVTDIATISNANDLLLQAKLEDTLNNLEIDTNSLSIGTDNPISYVRAQSFIVQDTGIIFQTGTPAQIIAKLEKNVNAESVLTVDRINVNVDAAMDNMVLNTLQVDTGFTANGNANFVANLQYSASLIESKETVTVTLSKNGTAAEGRLTLTGTSRKNIFVKLSAISAPNLNYVYDPGISDFDPTIADVILYVDFDANLPPSQNSNFTIHLVDVVENILQGSILTQMNANLINFKIQTGDNLSVTPTAPIILHNGAGLNLGINPNNPNPEVGAALGSTATSTYGHNATFLYIVDQNLDDRLIVTGMSGMEFF